MDSDRLATLVRQHAQTSRLMGVDFVPAFSGRETPPVAAVGAHEVEVKPRAVAPAAPARPTPKPAARPAIPAERTPESNLAALEELRRRYETDAPHANFDTRFNNIVFGEGDPCAKLVFIGEAPGEDEDKTGRPFVGRAGQLLDKMIAGMGLKREQVYICNVLKTRPPGNRTPTTDEVIACKPYLLEQLAIVRPEAAVALGLSATHALLDTTDSMARLRSRWWSFRDALGREVPLMPTYHPAFLLRSYTDENRAKVWEDLKLVMAKLGLRAQKAGAAS